MDERRKRREIRGRVRGGEGGGGEKAWGWAHLRPPVDQNHHS